VGGGLVGRPSQKKKIEEENVINPICERVLILIDLHNVAGMAASQGRSVNFPHLSRILADGRLMVGAHVFAGVHPFDGRRQEAFHAALERAGLYVHVRRGKLKRDGRLDLDADGVLILEALKLVEKVHPTTICLAAGDRDYSELVRHLRSRNVRIEVAAANHFLSRELHGAADKVILLDEYISGCVPIRGRFLQLELSPAAA
jgi:uncharacterized LabA/DUF88 family protein